jgi:hypothetical protein
VTCYFFGLVTGSLSPWCGGGGLVFPLGLRVALTVGLIMRIVTHHLFWTGQPAPELSETCHLITEDRLTGAGSGWAWSELRPLARLLHGPRYYGQA